MKLMERLKKDKKGFTLIEMIVVIVILGILLAILIPGLFKYIDKAKEKQVMVDARAAYIDAQAEAAIAYGLPGGNESSAKEAANNTNENINVETYDENKGITKMTYTDENAKKIVTLDGDKWKIEDKKD